VATTRARVEVLPADPDAVATEVFERNKKLVEEREPLFELEDKLTQAIADEHDMMEKKYASLDRRFRKIEFRGAILPEAKEENILFWLAVGFLLIEFVIPAVIKLVDQNAGDQAKGSLKP
jgi:hypothetical protein